MRLERYIGEKQSNDIFNDVAVKNLTSVTPISDINHLIQQIGG